MSLLVVELGEIWETLKEAVRDALRQEFPKIVRTAVRKEWRTGRSYKS